MLYKSIPNKAKFIEKIKTCCSAISKFALNSPCLLEFIRYNGELEVIISHDASNGNKYDFYKIFENLTFDEFNIPEEDLRYFEFEDKAISPPVVVSSIELDRSDKNEYFSLKYDICRQKFLVFPKFILEAIKAEYITDIEIDDIINIDKINYFDMNFKLDSRLDRFNYKTFIPAEPRLLTILNLDILPLGKTTNLASSTFLNLYNNNASAYVTLTDKDWDDLMTTNKLNSSFILTGQNNHQMIIYHNDFFQKKIKGCYIEKEYESPSNIVTLKFKVNMKNCVEYFKYKYYEL